MKLLTKASPLELWQSIVHEAEIACSIQLQAELEDYLVFLLIRYTDKPEIAQKIIATGFLEGLQTHSPKSRELSFQTLGDTCLLFSGLFPGIAEKRLVKISYFVNLGRSAYAIVSKTNHDIYSALASEFVGLMDVLQATRHYAQYPDLMPLAAYELWSEVGSQRALHVLKQYTAATPISLKSLEPGTCLIKIK